MQIKLKATKMEMTPALRDYCQDKMDMIERYLGGIQVFNCDVEIEKSVGGQHKGEIFRAEVNLQLPHEILRVEKTEEDMYKAIDKVKDHLEMAIKKYKDKLFDRKKASKLGAEILPEEEEDTFEEKEEIKGETGTQCD